MKKTDELFELVKSLSTSERKYLKIYASTHSQKKTNYLKLFDALCKWEGNYNELAFKEKHKGKSFIKKLEHEKAYLSEVILKTMRTQHASDDSFSIIQNHCLDFHFLSKKGLNRKAGEIIEKAIAIAEENDMIQQLILLSYHSLSVQIISASPSLQGKYLAREEKYLNTLIVATKSLQISDTFFEIVGSNDIEKKKKIVELKNEAEKLLKSPYHNFRSKKALLYLLGEYSNLISDYEKSFFYSELLYKEMISSKKGGSHFWVTTYNYLIAASKQSHWEIFPEVFDLIKRQPLNTNYQNQFFFFVWNTQQLEYNIYKRNEKEINILLDNIYKNLPSFRKEADLHKTIAILTMVARAELFSKNTYNAQKYINEIWNLLGRDFDNKGFLLKYRIMECLCISISGDFHLLKDSLRGVKRYIKTHSLENDFTLKSLNVLQQIEETQNLKSKSVLDANYLLQSSTLDFQELKRIFSDVLEN